MSTAKKRTLPLRIELPNDAATRFNFLHAQVVIATARRDGFLEAAKIFMGVPDEYGYSIAGGAFQPATPERLPHAGRNGLSSSAPESGSEA